MTPIATLLTVCAVPKSPTTLLNTLASSGSDAKFNFVSGLFAVREFMH